MRRATVSLALLGVLGLGACGNGEGPETTLAASTGTRTTLAQVAEQCAAPYNGEEGLPGVAIVNTELRDANTSVELPDCVIHLEQGADVHLNNVTITGGVVNLHDRDTESAQNRVKVQRSTVNTDGWLIELNDADDTLQIEASSITAAQGINLTVVEPGEVAGGDIRLVGSKLHATNVDASVSVYASEHSGIIRMVNTSADTQGLLTILASDCQAQLGGKTLDCSTAALEAGLE